MTDELKNILNKQGYSIKKVFNIKYLFVSEKHDFVDIIFLLKTCFDNNIFFIKHEIAEHYQKVIHIIKNNKDYYFMRVVWTEYGVLREHNEIRKCKILESLYEG